MSDIPNKKKVLNRLSRLEGQIRGVRGMIKKEKDCEEIVAQLSAVHSALEGATKLVLVNFLQKCLEECQEGDQSEDDAFERLADLLLKTRF